MPTEPGVLWPLGPCTGKMSVVDVVPTPVETVSVTGVIRWGTSYFIHGAAGDRALAAKRGD